MTATTRFAPSPTGRLHVGNARTALVNWLFARKAGGRFLLRFDDTDAARAREDFARTIAEDLRWLGLTWDQTYRQSERLDAYQQAFAQLEARGRIYACYETPAELEAKRRRQMARHRPPRYDRAGFELTEAERRRLEAAGRRPHWRFLLEDGDVAWTDLVRGPTHFHGSHLADPVVRREDGTWLYLLPSVIDDIAFGVSHVIRGEDHVANTPIQIQMFAALGAPPPAFAHLSLMTDADGGPLSKRLGSLTLDALRAQGIEAMALVSLLAQLGTSDAIGPALALDDLVGAFDIARFGRAAPKFDPAQLAALNARLLHGSPFAAVAERLARLGLAEADAAFWEAVRPNLRRLDDAKEWYGVCFGEIVPTLDDHAVADAAAALLPPEPWHEGTWAEWTRAVAEATGRRGKALNLPLRKALTGRSDGPELRRLLPLIGRARAVARLGGRGG